MTTTLTRRQQRMLDKAAQRGAEPLASPALLMDEAEARSAAAQIRAGLDGLRSLIADFDEREGWRALGYESFRAWALAEVDQTSLRHIYRLRDAADVDRSLGVTIGHTPESHARELAGVAPDERLAALERAKEIAGDRPVQAKDIRAAVRPERVADVALPPDVVAALDAAANAAPGTDARRKALAGAVVAVVQLPNGDARALAMERYQQLDAEHYAVIGQRPRAERPTPAPAPHDDDAATLAGAGWAPHASKARTWVKTDPADGMLWEMELADDADLARTAQLIRDRPDLDPDDLMLVADGAPVPSVEEADRVAMLASLDYVIDDLTAAGYTVAGWERNTPQGTVYTLRRGADVVRHTLHGLMLMLEATTPKAPPAAPAREALPKLPLALSDWRWESAPSNPGWCLRAPWTGSIVWTTDFFSDPQAAIAQAMRASQLAGRAMLVGAQITGAAGALDRRLVVRHPGGNGGGVYTLDELDQTIEGWVAAKFSAAEARTVAGAQQQRQANAHNPAWKSEGDRLARDLQEADDRGVVLTIAALFDGDGDGLPLASPGELADLEAHLVRAARAWAAGWLVKVGEATG